MILHENQRQVAVREQLTQPISDEPGPLPDPPLPRVYLHQQPARLLRHRAEVHGRRAEIEPLQPALGEDWRATVQARLLGDLAAEAVAQEDPHAASR